MQLVFLEKLLILVHALLHEFSLNMHTFTNSACTIFCTKKVVKKKQKVQFCGSNLVHALKKSILISDKLVHALQTECESNSACTRNRDIFEYKPFIIVVGSAFFSISVR